MARYNLIMRNEVYVALLQMAAAEGKTMGRYLNDLLEAHVSRGTEVSVTKTYPEWVPACGKVTEVKGKLVKCEEVAGWHAVEGFCGTCLVFIDMKIEEQKNKAEGGEVRLPEEVSPR